MMHRLTGLVLLIGCQDVLEPDASGVYILDDAFTMMVESASGPGSCDWLSEVDWELTAEQAPGYCVATATISGPAADPRTLIYYDTTGDTPLGTYGDDVVIDAIDSTSAEVNVLGIGTDENDLVVDLVWGAAEDPNTWEVATLSMTPVRWRL